VGYIYGMIFPARPSLLAALLALLALPGPVRAQVVNLSAAPPAWMGVALKDDGGVGVRVERVFQSSPAATAGIQAGDRILKVGGAVVGSAQAVILRVHAFQPGQVVRVDVRRGHQVRNVSVTLDAQPTPEMLVKRQVLGKSAPAFSGTVVPTAPGAVAAGFGPASMKGKVWILELWATWCGACRTVIPLLKTLHAQMAPNGLHLVAVAKDPPARAANAVTALQLPYLVVADPAGTAMQAFALSSIPAFFLIDAQGVVRDAAVGRTWAQDLAKLLKTAQGLLPATQSLGSP
jgi:cytochrome c biogenesis protein CcmG, thiol:disulfide interchange protein DsbE